MVNRRVLLVGSLPFENEPAAMAEAMHRVGEHLWSLPDGEVGERTEDCPGGTRSAWVQTIMDRCEADTSNWTVKRRAKRNVGGYAADYTSGPRLKPKHTPKDTAQHLDFGWADAARQSYPEFVRLRASSDRGDLRFQVGLPTGMGATFGMMDPITAMRYADAFSERMATEANEILRFTEPGDLAFQIEVPGELAFAHKLPKALAGLAAKRVIDLVERIETGAPIGIHLCFGDLNNEALINAPTLDKAVAFTNALLQRWPARHELSYIHFPLAEAAEPPPMDRAYYKPLGQLLVPNKTKFVAGFVHPSRSIDELRQIRDHIESIRGHEVDIACSCGMGRVEPETAKRLLDTSAELTR
ncbi:MAG: hypothetical protein R8J94_15825 [Acidimicrobiia bacterium]|nr:hypothetical protein [Acidimicrobiia bacterium]